jgi:sodium-independent sulfate anion transporter 11
VEVDDALPNLKAIILDFSSVNNVDITSVQQLIDVRNQLDRYASPERVDWHLACINNRWTKRALVSAGFGYASPEDPSDGIQHRWKPIFSVAEIGGWDSAASAAEFQQNEKGLQRQRTKDLETARGTTGQVDAIQSNSATSSASDFGKDISKTKAYGKPKLAVVHGLNRPLFHIDLTSALQSAIANVEARAEGKPVEVQAS